MADVASILKAEQYSFENICKNKLIYCIYW